MCKELELIQTHLGVWDISKWDLETTIKQLRGYRGVYLIRCKINNMLLIGEGALGSCGSSQSRIRAHIRNETDNLSFKNDLKLYGKEKFELWGFIIEDDAQTRKNIEYALHKHYKDTCYNVAKAPVWMILKLHKEGKTTKEIVEILNCDRRTVGCYIKNEKTSKYIGIHFSQKSANYQAMNKTNGTCVFLGSYLLEEEAAQNRDYYIVKNNLISKEILNFHDIDYTNFIPHKTTNGQVNKHLL
jgi:hypothetical protein